MSARSIPRVLSIAGTDPTGGAGIQADLKSISANGGYGMAVVTALVAQNTRGVRSVHVPPVAFLAEQLAAVGDDVRVDAVKIGMLGTAEVAETVGTWLRRIRPETVVLDPVMVATSGDRLLDANAEQALRALLAHVDIVTPNVPELAILADAPPARDWPRVLAQARRVAAEYGVLVVAKGGHLDGGEVADALVGEDDVVEVIAERVVTANTHGTGCSLSAALATRRAAGRTWAQALRETKAWLTESLREADALEVGEGNGPIHHFAGLWERGGLETRPSPQQVTAQWWADISAERERIDDVPFVRALRDGSLARSDFLHYLAQDAVYLRAYARVLADASRLAPDLDAQAFWAQSAHDALTAELSLHESWLPGDEPLPQADETTRAYLAHLFSTSAAGGYAELVAAVLPCFWIYADLGARMTSHADSAHPYRDWLDTYGDESIAQVTEQAIGFAARAAVRADADTRERMRDAFRASARHELAFFDAPRPAARR